MRSFKTLVVVVTMILAGLFAFSVAEAQQSQGTCDVCDIFEAKIEEQIVAKKLTTPVEDSVFFTLLEAENCGCDVASWAQKAIDKYYELAVQKCRKVADYKKRAELFTRFGAFDFLKFDVIQVACQTTAAPAPVQKQAQQNAPKADSEVAKLRAEIAELQAQIGLQTVPVESTQVDPQLTALLLQIQILQETIAVRDSQHVIQEPVAPPQLTSVEAIGTCTGSGDRRGHEFYPTWLGANTRIFYDCVGWSLDNPKPDFSGQRTRVVIQGESIPTVLLQAVFWNPSIKNGQQITVDRVWQPADAVWTGGDATPLVVDNCDVNGCYGHVANAWLVR